MHIVETRGRDLLRKTLARNPAATLYMAGDLEEPAFSQCRWFASIANGEAPAVLLLYTGLSVPTVLGYGDVSHLAAILDEFEAALPRQFYTKLTAEQWATVDARYRLDDREDLAVMTLTHFKPAAPPPGIEVRMVREGEPSNALEDLYRHYPGNFFDPSQLPFSRYAVACAGTEVVAAAGTHAFAPSSGVVAIGNVVTAEHQRGRGVARATVSLLSQNVMDAGCPVVGLHVAVRNTPALRSYSRLGFKEDHRVAQVMATRR